MDKPLFNLATLPEADEFLDSLAPVVVRKVFYNIRKVAGGVKDPELFKKISENIWSFAPCIRAWHTACLLFGIKTVKRSLLPHTDL